MHAHTHQCMLRYVCMPASAHTNIISDMNMVQTCLCKNAWDMYVGRCNGHEQSKCNSKTVNERGGGVVCTKEGCMDEIELTN
jgi:hypothetical protein